MARMKNNGHMTVRHKYTITGEVLIGGPRDVSLNIVCEKGANLTLAHYVFKNEQSSAAAFMGLSNLLPCGEDKIMANIERISKLHGGEVFANG